MDGLPADAPKGGETVARRGIVCADGVRDMGGGGGTEPTVWRRDVEPCTVPLHRNIPQSRTVQRILGDRGAAGGELFIS